MTYEEKIIEIQKILAGESYDEITKILQSIECAARFKSIFNPPLQP